MKINKEKIVKINRLSNYIKELQKERANVESDIEFIKCIGAAGPISERRKDLITYYIEQLNKYKIKIERLINSENNIEIKEILTLRYIQGLTIQEISDKMNYSVATIFRKLEWYNGN